MNNDVRQRIIEVTARHFKAPKALRTFCEKEVRKLNRYYDGILDYHIVLTHSEKEELAEIVANAKGHRFVAHQTDEKMDRAVVLAVEKIKSQLFTHTGKLVG